MIVSDHGMMNVSSDHRLMLNDLIDVDSVNITDFGAFVGLNAKDSSNIAQLYSSLKANSTSNHYQVFLNEEMESAKPLWHYGSSERISDILLVADIGWSFSLKEYTGGPLGVHGWDPAAPQMHAMLYTAGPCFKPGVTADAMQNTELYTMMTRCLGIPGAPTNATTEGKNNIDGLMAIL